MIEVLGGGRLEIEGNHTTSDCTIYKDADKTNKLNVPLSLQGNACS